MPALGPWPQGVDTRRTAERTHDAFQQGREGGARLFSADNVDITDDGWVTRRDGLTERVDATAGLNCYAGAGLLLAQDGGTIKKITTSDWSASSLVTGLGGSDAVQFCEHAGSIFWTDATDDGFIDSSGTARNFGCALCEITSLSAVSGSLPAGEYAVAGEFQDATGRRHAAEEAATITLTSTGGIQVSISSIDANATTVRLYLAGPNDPRLYRVGDISVGAFPYTIVTKPTEDTICWSIGLSPPPTSDFMFSWQDRLMLVSGAWIYPSLGAAAHLFDLDKTAVQRPETVLAGGGLPGGFWTVSSRGAYWVSGDDPMGWRQTDPKYESEFCAGSLPVNSSTLPGLGLSANTPIILFWCSWGLAVGLPSGEMLFPMQDRHRSTVSGLRASFGYCETASGVNQLIVNVG